ncbi:MAG: YbaB/EbfC family nucleoid-associated protein [Planctomycetales bacterium]
MFKGIGNLVSVLKHAGQIQGKVGELKEELAKVRVEGSAGGGMVIVEASGHHKVLAVRIDSSLANGDREMLEELVAAAVNQALDKAKQAAAEQMSRLAEGMDIPGLGDMLEKMGLNTNPVA